MKNAPDACARRIPVMALVLGICSVLSMADAGAQSGWKPAKPVEFVNPAAPGGSVDLMIRLTKKFAEDTRTFDVRSEEHTSELQSR